jgi:hypothetical protein
LRRDLTDGALDHFEECGFCAKKVGHMGCPCDEIVALEVNDVCEDLYCSVFEVSEDNIPAVIGAVVDEEFGVGRYVSCCVNFSIFT